MNKRKWLLGVVLTAGLLTTFLSALINRPTPADRTTKQAWQAEFDEPQNIDQLQQQLEDQLLERQVSKHFLTTEQVDQQFSHASLESRLMLLTRSVTTREQPSAGELEAFFQRRREDYRKASQISLRQVVYTSAIHGGMALSKAQQALAASLEGLPPNGDTSRLDDRYGGISSLALGNLIGLEASQKIVALARYSDRLPCWDGPISSSIGIHLVCVETFSLGDLPKFDDVRSQVINDWRYARVAEAQRAVNSSTTSATEPP
ncbi:MAG: hypothetical protein OSA42_01535 [Porticoccaceae bacterium]|nr:hypothetical protein [Porticoccaceae bacterium]